MEVRFFSLNPSTVLCGFPQTAGNKILSTYCNRCAFLLGMNGKSKRLPFMFWYRNPSINCTCRAAMCYFIYLRNTIEKLSVEQASPRRVKPLRSGSKDTLCIFPIIGYPPNKENRTKEDSSQKEDDSHLNQAGSGSFSRYCWYRLVL